MWYPGDPGALSEYSDCCREVAFDDTARRSSRVPRLVQDYYGVNSDEYH